MDVPTKGARSFGEFKRSGEKWSGMWRNIRPCTEDGRVVRVCQVDIVQEFTLVTPGRIEGSGVYPQHNSKIDCSTCEFDRPFERRAFSWIPADL